MEPDAGAQAVQIMTSWYQTRADHSRGGLYTWIDPNSGGISRTCKYSWAQGRWAWVTAQAGRLAQQGLLPPDRVAPLVDHGRITARLMLKEFVAGDEVHPAIASDGSPWGGPPAPRGLFALLFASLALAAGAQTGDRELLPEAERLLLLARARLKDATFPTEPLPVPAGTPALAPWMIALSTALALDDAGSAVGRQVGEQSIAMIATFWTGELFQEYRPAAGSPAHDLQDLCNTGHSLEVSWFLLAAARRDWVSRDVIDVGAVATGILSTLARAWDRDHGGLRRFIHVRPLTLAPASWPGRDDKVWWVHAEALAALSFTHDREGQTAEEWLARVWSYATETFIDPANADWTGVFDETGEQPSMLTSTGFVPLQDPFHQVRALLLLHEAGLRPWASSTSGQASR